MSFINEAITNSMDIWQQCYKTPFVQEMAKGTLPNEKFKNYIIQDSIYLKQYAKVFAMAIYKATTLKEMQMFYNIMGFVTEGESKIRLEYLSNLNMTDDDIELESPSLQNVDYTDFMLGIAETYDTPEILMAVLPCMLGYEYVMLQAIYNYKDIEHSPYWNLISDYAQDNYRKECESWRHYTDKICAPLPTSRKNKLIEIFRESSLHELKFWEMVYCEVKK